MTYFQVLLELFSCSSWGSLKHLAGVFENEIFRSTFIKLEILGSSTSWFRAQHLAVPVSWSVRRIKLDQAFQNFKTSKSLARRILCSSGTSSVGFWSSKIVRVSVGRSVMLQLSMYLESLRNKDPTETFSFHYCFRVKKRQRLTSSLDRGKETTLERAAF